MNITFDPNTISGVFNNLAMAGIKRKEAEMNAGLRDAQMYQATMAGNKLGAQAEGEQFTLGRRKALLDAPPSDGPSYQQFMDRIFVNSGDTNAENLAKAAQIGQNMGFKGQAAEYVGGDRSKLNEYLSIASGKVYEPYKANGVTGYSVDEATGAQIKSAPELFGLHSNVQNSIAAENNAQAYNARMSGNQHVAQTNKINRDPAPASAGGTTVAPAPVAKPMPSSALKLQQEELDTIGTASGTQADIAAIEQQIRGGKLDFGPVSNLVNRGKNMIGASDEESRNFSSFRANIEKMRNDSLRLNKGVQTDGDAQRAWNELFENINDRGVVLQRLTEIKRINERAVALRKLNVDNIRANYGQPPMDTSGYQNVSAAIGGKPSLSADEAAELEQLRKRFGR